MSPRSRSVVRVTWIGYQLDPQSLRTFIQTLIGDTDYDLDNTIDLVGGYAGWKMSLPDKAYSKAPDICFRYSASDPEVIAHLFFPMHYIPFESEQQLKDIVANGPTEEAKAMLKEWIAYTNQKKVGEKDIRADLFEFAAMKGPHPSHRKKEVW